MEDHRKIYLLKDHSKVKESTRPFNVGLNKFLTGTAAQVQLGSNNLGDSSEIGINPDLPALKEVTHVRSF